MRIDILTLFPEMFVALQHSILKRAQDKSLFEIHLHNIRDFSTAKHRQVDDVPFGGGDGMVMMPEPLWYAIEAVKKLNDGPVIYLSAQGKTFTQAKAERMATQESFILLCGHYEGIDERVREHLIDEEISIGNYVLTGGELPAMVLIDSMVRLIPGVLGKEGSHQQDSFSKAFKRKREHPHYTRPADFRGMKVPDVLLSGHHKEIEKWRRAHLQ